MKRAFVAVLSGLVLFVGAPRTWAEGAEVAGYRLFYVFSPDQAEQRLHALVLDGLARSIQGKVQVVGLARTVTGASEALGQSLGLSYPLFAAGAWKRAGAPDGVREHVAPGPDYALLVDRSGQPVEAGPGEQLSRILSRFAAAVELATDVDESTWGKVKELFR
jgi:hypothetical protein